jgi:hypothetical protein
MTANRFRVRVDIGVTHQVAFAVDHGFAPLFAASICGLTGLMSIGGHSGVAGSVCFWLAEPGRQTRV